MTVLVSEVSACPLCGRPIAPAFLPIQSQLEPHIACRLREQNPGWEPEAGACPECVHQAVEQARQARSQTSLQHELLLPYPVYSPDEAGILPTPRRVQANPHYAGQGVTLAFLDSGFYPHPDLTRPTHRILAYADATGPEVVEKTSFKRPYLTSWHGLMTSCIAAGNGYLSDGLYRGIASRSTLVLVKTGNRRGRGIRERDIYRALGWVIANRERFNIRVVNISLGGDHPSAGKLTELDELVEEAVAQGMVVVTAAGNSGQQRLLPPASAPSAITVGGLDDQNSLDRRFHRLWHSSYGLGPNRVPKPEVIAPSIWLAAPMLPKTWVHNEALFLWQLDHASNQELTRLLRTDYAEARFKKETLRKPLDEVRRIIRERMIKQKYIHSHYQHVDGTSMAAPIVSAVAAQMLEANPRLAPAQVRGLIMATADRLAGVPEEQQGAGAVNAGAAVAAALRAPGGLLEGLPRSPRVTRKSVTFYYLDREARHVALAGSFNAWQPGRQAVHGPAPGLWQVTIPRPPRGTYRYRFLVDGHKGVYDPENPNRVEDGCGGFDSLLDL